MYNGVCVSDAIKEPFPNRTHLQRNSKDDHLPETSYKDVVASNGEGLEEEKGDKKLIKILQRPISVRSVDGRIQLEEGPRRNHRKKTLSLNPEEREALESLIEDVIIVGLDDVIVDSDDSADDLQIWGNQRFTTKPGPDALRSNNSRDNRGSRIRTNQENKMDLLPKSATDAAPIHNNINKDFRSRDSSFGNAKNIGRESGRINDVPLSLQQLPTKANDEDSKEKAINGMVGVNIYPAQLKVAIKHMDSLPPRFLRRLQSGQQRIGGSDPALQNLTEPINREILLKAVEGSIISQSSSTPSSIEKDRTKSKQNHLFETKKSIRNLLDQYSDDVTHSNDAGDDSKRLEFLPSVPIDAFKSTGFENRNGLFRSQPNQMFGSDPHLNFDTYAPMEFINLPLMARNSQRDFLQPMPDRSNSFGTSFMQNGLPHIVSPKAGATVNHTFSYSGTNGYAPFEMQQTVHLPKKKKVPTATLR